MVRDEYHLDKHKGDLTVNSWWWFILQIPWFFNK